MVDPLGSDDQIHEVFEIPPIVHNRRRQVHVRDVKNLAVQRHLMQPVLQIAAASSRNRRPAPSERRYNRLVQSAAHGAGVRPRTHQRRIPS